VKHRNLLVDVAVAVGVFLCTFVAGVLERGLGVWDPSYVHLLIEGAIAAGLGVLGFELTRIGVSR
jgi:hypothetical protein